MGGAIAESPTGALAKAGLTPRDADWAITFDLGSSAQNRALAFEIPKDSTIGLYSDSVLSMHSGKTKAAAPCTPWSHLHSHYYVNQKFTMGGATCRQILLKLPADEALFRFEKNL